MSEPHCWNCRYFDRDPNSTEDGGYCRRYPPQSTDEGTACIWPGIDYMDWCGEFKPKEDE